MSYSRIVVLVAFLLALSFPATAFTGDGSGTSSNPYEINQCSDFDNLDSKSNRNFEMVQDVDCQGTSVDPNSGGGYLLDGKGYTLSNLDIAGGNTDNTALIAGSNEISAEVRNMTFDNVNLPSGSCNSFNCGIILSSAGGSGVQVNNVTLKNSAYNGPGGSNNGPVIGGGSADVDGIRIVNVQTGNAFIGGDPGTGQYDNIVIADSTLSGAGTYSGLFKEDSFGCCNGNANDVLVYNTTMDGGYQTTNMNNVYYDQDNSQLYPGETWDGQGRSTSQLQGLGTVNDLGFPSNRWSDTLGYPDLSWAVDNSPDFQVVSTSTNGPIDENSSINVTAVVENQGLSGGEKQVTGYIDGNQEYSEQITLNSGENTTISFQKSFGFQSSGSHSYEVSTPDDSNTGSFQVNNVDLPDPNKPVIMTPEDGYTFYIENNTEPYIPETSAYLNLDQDHPEGIRFGFNYTSTIGSSGGLPASTQATYTTAGNRTESASDIGLNLIADQDGSINVSWVAQNAEGVSKSSEVRTINYIIRENPTINNFDINPSISNINTGEFFDLSADGGTGSFDISNITYSLSVTNQNDPSDIVVNPDYSDSSSWNDQENDAFEFLESYKGEEVTLKVIVTDSEGFEDSKSVSINTAVEPDNFILNAPDDNENFLTPNNQNTVDVTFDYGVDTSKNGGTVELIVDGQVKDSFSISADTSQSQTYTEAFSKGSYAWKVRFTDGTTGDVYESGFRTFDVFDKPLGIGLKSPTGGDEIEIVGQSETDVNHTFEIDARATNNDYYYRFELKNDTNGNVLESRTSNDLNTGMEDFTETVQNLGEGDYRWNISAYFSSDDSLQSSESTTYSVNENPLFDQRIVEPLDGAVYELAGNQDIDINSSYKVTAYETDVDTTLSLDGSQVTSSTTSSGSSETVKTTLQDVGLGEHTLTLEGEDGDSRTRSTSVTFEVVDKKNLSVREVRTFPSLDKARKGDTLDVYFEGVNESEVDYVQVDVLVNGTTEETIKVPGEDLNVGSFFYTIGNALGTEVTEELIGSDVEIRVTAFDVVGRVANYLLQGVVGSDRDPGVGLERPPDGKKFQQVNGTAENIELEYTISTVDNPVDYNVYVNGSQVKTGTISQTDTSVTRSTYVNVVNDLNADQFGQFNWKVNLTEQNSQFNTSSPSRNFKIIEETDEPVLNLNRPQDNEQFTIQGDYNTATVPLQADWEVSESGTVDLEVDGSSVGNFPIEVSSGFDSERITREIPPGTYNATLSYDSESYQASVKNVFAVDRDVPDATVSLREPDNDSVVYQGVGQVFSWRVTNAETQGTTYLEIDDSGNNNVRNFSREYGTQNEIQVYRELRNVNLSPGEYEMTAYLSDGQTTQSSETWSFEVKDFNRPKTSLDVPKDGETFVEGNAVPFNFSVETFDQEATAELRLREAGEVDSRVLLTNNQPAFTTEPYSAERNLEPGKYEYFVRLESNPTFESSVNSFTVEEKDIKDAQIYPDVPRQDERYIIPNSSNTALVEFNYSARVYSGTDANVSLLLEEVENGNGQGFNRLERDKQNDQDGNVSYSYNRSLEEKGYRWKVRVDYQNGQTFESNPRSFAVGEADIPVADPSKSIIDRGASLFGDLNDTFKAAVGSGGQFFAATFILLFVAGSVQLLFDVKILTALTSVLMALGFSIVEGYYPFEIFYIVLALSMGMLAWIGARAFGGGD